MAIARYVKGSKELFIVDMTCTEADFAVAEWTGELAFSAVGETFDADTATWIPAALVAGASTSVFSAEAMQEQDMTLDVGQWYAYVRLTKASGDRAEQPVLKADGYLSIT